MDGIWNKKEPDHKGSRLGTQINIIISKKGAQVNMNMDGLNKEITISRAEYRELVEAMTTLDIITDFIASDTSNYLDAELLKRILRIERC